MISVLVVGVAIGIGLSLLGFMYQTAVENENAAEDSAKQREITQARQHCEEVLKGEYLPYLDELHRCGMPDGEFYDLPYGESMDEWTRFQGEKTIPENGEPLDI